MRYAKGWNQLKLGPAQAQCHNANDSTRTVLLSSAASPPCSTFNTSRLLLNSCIGGLSALLESLLVQAQKTHPALSLLLLANTASKPWQHLAVGPNSLQASRAALTGCEAHAVSGLQGRSDSLMGAAAAAVVPATAAAKFKAQESSSSHAQHFHLLHVPGTSSRWHAK